MKIEIVTGADNNPVAEYFSSSSTPETDAVTSRLFCNVSADFARKLKLERDEMQKAINGLCEHFKINPANTTLLAVELLKIERERDEARLELEEYRSIAENIGAEKAVSEKEKATRERDEAIQKYDNLVVENMLEINKICNQRDAAIDSLMKIEEIFIDGDDTYEDWKSMGQIARTFLEKTYESRTN